MEITFDPRKRDITLRERGLDFASAARIFEGRHIVVADDRFDYGEERFITAGYLGERMIVFVWTQRGDARHIISMRHCHEKEQERWRKYMDRSG